MLRLPFAHSRTRNLPEILKQADVIVAAVGKACFVKPEMVKEGVVIVDVGINAVDGKLVGDVDPAVAEKGQRLYACSRRYRRCQQYDGNGVPDASYLILAADT